MDISVIGANAGSVWNALHENGELDLTKLKKETKKGSKTVEFFSLVD